MAEAAVGADLHQPFDVLGALAAKVALDLAPLDRLAQADDLVLGQVLDQGGRVDFVSARISWAVERPMPKM